MSEISKETLESLAISHDIETIRYQTILDHMQQDQALSSHRPDSQARVDPRTGVYVLFSESRRHRPCDYPQPGGLKPKTGCPICSGKTTAIWDLTPLTQGYTFINENLFPALFPFADRPWPAITDLSQAVGPQGLPALGTHFLQWHSNQHEKDLHNMPVADVCINLQRLAALEKFLLTQPSPMPVSHEKNGVPYRGYLGIVKNYGRQVGGSLSHGHIQIFHSNIIPKRLEQDYTFLQKNCQSVSRFIQEQNASELLIKQYGNGTLLVLTPFFIKRPFEVIFCFQDISKNYLHELSSEELRYLAQAIREMTATIVELVPFLSREPSYNLIFHVGPIGGLYIEILPFSQDVGGSENLGIYLSHFTPQESAMMCRNKVENIKL